MNQITVFSRNNPILLVPAILLFASIAQPLEQNESNLPEKPAMDGKKIEKDEILEELQFSAKGIPTDPETKEIISTDHSVPSTQQETPKDVSSDSNTAEKDQSSQPHTENTVNEGPPFSSIEEKINLELTTVKNQRKQEYDSSPSRVKKEELEAKLNKLISENPKNEQVYWELFDLYHHYIEWSEGTEFYQENQVFQALKLLQSINKRFGENQKITKYLCQYMIINHFYEESKSYCQKAKRFFPDDTDLYILVDYLRPSTKDFNQEVKKGHKNKSKVLLNILKNKPSSTKLYTTIGNMFLNEKKYNLSMRYFKKAVKLDPSYIPGLLGLAQVLMKLNQPEAALDYYVLSCKKNPYKSRTPFQQAKAYLNQKSSFKLASKYQNQINVCINAIKIFP